MCLLSRNGNSIREISIPFPTYQSASPFTLRGSLPPDVYIIFPSFSRAILISKKFDVDPRQNRTDFVRCQPTEDTDVSLRSNDETFHGLPS